MAPQTGITSDDFRNAIEAKLSNGGYAEAMQILDDELTSVRRQNDQASVALVLLYKAEAHLLHECGADALQAARSARSAFQKLGDTKLEAFATIIESYALVLLEQLQQAGQVAQTAKKLAESTGDNECIARAWHMVSMLEDGASSSHGMKTAIDHYREVGDLRSEALVLCNLSQVMLFEGHFEEALNAAEDAASICKSLGLWADEVCALNCIVSSRISKRQTHYALEVVTERLIAYERAEDRSAHAALLLLAADAYYANHESNMAVSAATKSQEIFAAMGDWRQAAIAQLKLANLHLAQQQFGDALRFGQEARSTFREVGVPLGEKEANQILSTIYTAKGEPEKSPYRQQAITHMEELGVAIGKSDADAYHQAINDLQLTGGMTEQDYEMILAPLIMEDEQRVKRFLKEMEKVYSEEDKPVVAATQIETATTYHNFKTGGLQYGPAFRRIQDSWRIGSKNSMDAELYTVLQLHDDAASWEDALPFLHPGIADGSLQCQVALQG